MGLLCQFNWWRQDDLKIVRLFCRIFQKVSVFTQLFVEILLWILKFVSDQETAAT